MLGIGLLNRDPAVNGGAWQVVKGDDAATDPDTLRGESFFRIVADPAHKDQLVAATTKGVLRSAYGRRTFLRICYP